MEAKYTLQLNEIDISDIFDFSFTLYGANASEEALHKSEFISRFYKYYYFDEINAENVYGFNRLLERVMSIELAKFNKLFEKSRELLDGSLINYNKAKTTSATNVSNNQSDRNLKSSNTYLDVASVPLGQTQDDYASNINRGESDEGISESNERLTNVNENETYQEKDKIGTFDDLYKAYKDLDSELIKKFKQCFMLVY